MKYLAFLLAPLALACNAQKSPQISDLGRPVPPSQETASVQMNEIPETLAASEGEKSTSSIYDQGETVEHMVLIRAERMPAWPGCEVLVNAQVKHCTNEMLSDYIASNTRYPEQAKYQNIEGIVYVYYEVNTSGEIENTRVERKAHELLNKEALRVINSLPVHDPGMQNGKRVRVGYTVPVHFPPNR